MNCPECGTWAIVKETRKRPDKTMRRRYECANLHRFTTIETITATRQLKPKQEPQHEHRQTSQ